MREPTTDDSGSPPSGDRRRYLADAATAIVALWATRPFWWPGRYVASFDGYTYSGPNLAVTEQALRDGRLALWNDAIFGGVTHLGNPQSGTLYPPRLLILLLENNRALGVLAAAHVVLLGLGMVALTRRMGMSVTATAFAGCVAVLNGAVLTKSIQFEQILVIAWAPWLLVAIHATLTGRRPWLAICATAAVTAAILLAGHPQMVFETIALAVAATLGFVAVGSRWRRLPHVLLGVGLGALIALPQLLAAAIATSQSIVRSGRTDAALLDPALSLVPGAGARALLGSIDVGNPATFVGSFESVAFVGVVVAVLAVVGLVDAVGRVDRRPWALAFAVCGALGLVWSFGPRTIVFRAASEVVPGFDLARGSARWLVVVALVLIVFAAAGLDCARCGLGRRTLLIAGASVLLSGALIAIRDLHGGDTDVAIQWLLLAVAAVAVLAMASNPRARSLATTSLTLIAIVELGMMSRNSFAQLLSTDTPFTSPSLRLPTTEWLAGREGYVVSFTDDLREPAYGVPGLRPNANVLVGIRSIDGYDGGVQITDRWAAALRRINADPAVEFPLRNSVPHPLDAIRLGRLGVRYVLIDRTRPIADMVPGWIGPRASDESFEVWENPEWVGEAIAWSIAEVVDPDAAPDLLRERADELTSTVLVAELDEPLVCAAAGGSECAPVPLDVDRRSPEHVVVGTDLSRRTVVTIDQQYEPGWSVEVDGAAAELLEVDGLVMGVDVPSGPHEVTWRYRPAWLTPALIVAGIAALATFALALRGPASHARLSRHEQRRACQHSGANSLTDLPP